MSILRNVVRKIKRLKMEYRVFSDFPEFKKDCQPVYEDKIHLEATMNWLCLAQDISGGGGVSAIYNLKKKSWGRPYRETTGYIISTFINYNKITGNKEFEKRALQMGEWELREQLPDGAYGEESKNALGDVTFNRKVFNTGQVILGLCLLYNHTNEIKYIDAAKKSAEWLLSIQEEDGSWIKFTTAGPKTYHARVAWALLEVYKITSIEKFKIAAIKNIDWVMREQNENDWFNNCSLAIPNKPWTHLIAYTLRGLLESSTILNSEKIFLSAYRAADKMLTAYESYKNNKFNMLPGTFDNLWQSSDRYSCLTGDMQTAIVWQKIYDKTKEVRFRDGNERIINQVKSTHITDSKHTEIIGGVLGSYPIGGDYAEFAMPNWAAKFFADAIMMKNYPNLREFS